MAGFSLTLLLLPPELDSVPSTATILSLLDDPSGAPGWKWTANVAPLGDPITPGKRVVPTAVATSAGTLKAADPKAFVEAIQRACKALNDEEAEITRMDNIAGDGDCGLTLRDGANGAWRVTDV